MGVFLGTNLSNRSDIIDTLMSRIITEVLTPPAGAGEVIVRDRSTGSVGADDVEQWITIPATRMSSGKAMPFGYQPAPAAVNYLYSNSTHLDFATASAAGARAFGFFDGQPMNKIDEDGSSTETDAPASNGYAIATPYLRHWIVTNPNFGALIANYGVGERTYMYVVVEVNTNVFRIFGWCDVIQRGTWPTTAAGFYQFGTLIEDNADFGSSGGPGANIFMASVYGRAGLAPNANVPGGIAGADQNDHRQNWLYQPDRDGVPRDWITNEVFLPSDFFDTHTTNESRALGSDHDFAPAAFSGVALRTPMHLYATRWTAAQVAAAQSFQDADVRLQLIAEIPDAFFCNIRDLDPGTIFVDGIDRFLVLPLYEKGQLGGNLGILLRNPAF